jgi:Zn-dependent M16 (insulinase) family peptidase
MLMNSYHSSAPGGFYVGDFTRPVDTLTNGSSHHGFVVTQVIELKELSGYAYVFKHEATGARLMWLACADTNKSFSISFKTPPNDSTGTFHILEHSVLCGSDRFPVKEPFVNLLKTSMQTFLNAMTFSDKTMYPVASTNTQDLENLMDVYLDAVLHPAIYTRRRIFEQEGWHLELVDADGAPAQTPEADSRLVYNGVVFNEMKGALSDPDTVLIDALDNQLFPDTAYRFVSGGDPADIPQLTYEAFLDNHARHYQLKNSYTILYGDMDIERELAFIDKRFCKAEKRDAGAPNALALQEPQVAAPVVKEMATAPENAQVGLAYVIGTALDRTKIMAADVLLDALAGSNEAPLKRAVLDAGIGDDLGAYLADGELQPRIIFQLKGAHAGAATRFKELVEKTCADLVANKIDRKRLLASLAQMEFNLREGDWGTYSDGVALSIRALSSWLYDDAHPVDYLLYEDALTTLKQGVDQGLFEQLLDDIICHSNHCAEVELKPTDQGSARETEELLSRKAAMSTDELEAVIAEVRALREEQEAPDSPEALASLPQLSLKDIGPAPQEPPLLEVEAPLPCIAHELDCHHISYVHHYFSLENLGYEELVWASVLADVLGKLDTEEHSANELDMLTERYLGFISFYTESITPADDLDGCVPLFVVSCGALSQNMDYLARLPREIWSSTQFGSSVDRIRDILQQKRILLEQSYVNAGSAAAVSRLDSYFSPAACVSEQLGGVEYYRFLKKLLANFDELKDYVVDRLSDVSRRIFVQSGTTVSFTGTAEDRARYWDAAGDLGLPATQLAKNLVLPVPRPRNEAFIIPAHVAFVAEGCARHDTDTHDMGTWLVASKAITLDYLWNEVRVKGGAYGVGFRRSPEGLRSFYSYRDPALDATLARYNKTATWLANWQPTPAELEGYIISTVASLDTPIKPAQLARRQNYAYFARKPKDWRAQDSRSEPGGRRREDQGAPSQL